MPDDKKKILNGFSVCGCVVAVLAFVASFYVYMVRYVPIENPVHVWFRLLCPNSVLLAAIAMIMCIIGLVTIARHEEYFGKFPAVLGITLSAFALLHVTFWWIVVG